MYNKEVPVWFHADDYGVTKEQSERILACMEQGVMNSISVLPNSDVVSECLDILDNKDPEHKVRRVLHLNLVEGRPAADKDKVKLLVDKQGMFCRSFFQLWLWNYNKRGRKREELLMQLKEEIAAQVDMVTEKYDYHISAVDSHQHYHMIPIVFDALMAVLEEKHLTVKEIRIPVDPISPLLKTKGMFGRVPAINWVKWLILRKYKKRNRKVLQVKGIESPAFFGIFFTCEMKTETVRTLLPAYMEYAAKKHQTLELMFHPGNLMARSELPDERRDEMAEFYMSQNRYAEAECLKQLKIGFGERHGR